MNEEFVKFHNNVDRKNSYSKNVSMDQHPFYKQLTAFVDNFDL